MQELYIHLLTNKRLLKDFHRKGIGNILNTNPESLKKEIQRYLFPEFHSRNKTFPDHVFKRQWEMYSSEMEESSHWSTETIKLISEKFLDECGGRTAVKLDLFGTWQNMISRISGLPIQAAHYSNVLPEECCDNTKHLTKIIRRRVGKSPFLTPWDPEVEEYINRVGLYDTHQHLNGSTPAEMCWTRFLRDPLEGVKDIEKAYRDHDIITELFSMDDEKFSPQILVEYLRTAQKIRSLILLWLDEKYVSHIYTSANGEIVEIQGLLGPDIPYKYWNDIGQNNIDYFSDVYILNHCENDIAPDRLGHSDPVFELHWMIRLCRKLSTQSAPHIDRLFHWYLLIEHRFLALTVQRDDLWGFDEFQKYTMTEIRETAEKEYLQRFNLFHGNAEISRAALIEGRFSPKKSAEDNIEILTQILHGFALYNGLDVDSYSDSSAKTLSLDTIIDYLNSNRTQRMKLKLLGHFIKLKDPDKGDYRFHHFSRNLWERAEALCETFKMKPQLREWFHGIDAASNELHTPPEVFAPIFRYCRSRLHGLKASFHAGEDFHHLIGGIRAINDAVRFLDLATGDRVGHATAIGIDSQIWLNTMPDYIRVQRDEWLLDMLCAWDLLQDVDGFYREKEKVQSEISRMSRLIFKDEHEHTISSLLDFDSLRGLFIRAVVDVNNDEEYMWESQSLSDPRRAEYKKVVDLIKEGRRVDLLTKWHSDEVILRSVKMEKVRADFLSAEVLCALQQQMLHRLHKARVSIETLPTSNVRISQYDSIQQHHLFRWMGIDGKKKDGDPAVEVSLGSDDPGIFATDITGEFYHIYAILRNELGMNDREALEHVARVNERGRALMQ